MLKNVGLRLITQLAKCQNLQKPSQLALYHHINSAANDLRKFPVNSERIPLGIIPQSGQYSCNTAKIDTSIYNTMGVGIKLQSSNLGSISTFHHDFNFPSFDIIEQSDPLPNILLELPSTLNKIKKEAARLIVIRRRKMKKHKLRKLRKKMKFEWAKVRHRREVKKEKAFQMELLTQIKEAEKFDVAHYVAEKLQKINTSAIKLQGKS